MGILEMDFERILGVPFFHSSSHSIMLRTMYKNIFCLLDHFSHEPQWSTLYIVHPFRIYVLFYSFQVAYYIVSLEFSSINQMDEMKALKDERKKKLITALTLCQQSFPNGLASEGSRA